MNKLITTTVIIAHLTWFCVSGDFFSLIKAGLLMRAMFYQLLGDKTPREGKMTIVRAIEAAVKLLFDPEG